MSEGSTWSLDEAFAEALDRSGAERAEFIAQLGALTPRIAAEVASLIAAHDRAANFLLESPTSVELTDALEAADPLIGSRLGPYELVELRGRGGMSRVYVAERRDGDYDQRVAVKIIDRAIDATAVRRRFRVEAQALARLEHPNIARLIDAGVGEDRRPYLVMELVEGQPFDEYVRASGLSVDDTLRLFLRVCDAVSAAHTRLIVHRDIKPSNILVDAHGRPRLLDFGVARILEPDAPTEDATATQQLALTPSYASPEHLRGEPVTTTSDVYSLGVLLYELLTADLPIRVERGSAAEVERRVFDTDPARPSDAVSERADSGRRRRLRGDLDRIVLHALEKQPNRRYPTVDRFAEDIRRHLAGLPVTARRATLPYRASKFLRRNRLAAAAGTGVVLALTAGLIVSVSQSRRADRERAVAEAVSDFASELFSAPNPFAFGTDRPDTLRMRALLAAATERARRGLPNEPRERGRMLNVLGDVHLSLGMPSEAEQLQREAYRALTRGDASESELAEVTSDLGHANLQLANLVVADSLLSAAWTTRVALLGENHPDALSTAELYARGLIEQARLDEAGPILERVVESRRSELGPQHPLLAEAMNSLAAVRYDEGRYDEATRLVAEVVDIYEADDRDPAGLAVTMHNLAVMQREGGNQELAVRTLRDARAVAASRLDDDHPALTRIELTLGSTLGQMGQEHRAEADEMFGQGVESLRRRLGGDHPDVASALLNQGSMLQNRRQFDRAEPLLVEATAIFERVYGATDPRTAFAQATLAVLLANRRELEEAEDLSRRALSSLEGSLDSAHPMVLFARAALARARLRQGDVEGLEASLRADLERAESADVRRTIVVVLAELYRSLGRESEAEELEREGSGVP